MKIEYIRQLQTSYMRIELKAGLGRTEEEMLSHNRIHGILPVGWQREDEKILLRYDITGKIALDALLEEKKADAALLERIISGICSAVRQLEKFLLRPEGLLLCPEAVFCDYKTGEVLFCYFPEEELPFTERLQRFMEYLLTKTDHKNKEAVDIAYGLYEELLKPAYSLSDIQSFLQERHTPQKEEIKMEAEQLIMRGEETGKILQEETLHRRINPDDWLEAVKRSVKEKMSAWVNEREWRKIKRQRPGNRELAFEIEEEKEQEEFATELLSERHGKENRILKYEGTDALPDIVITRFPFLIGSTADCDGIIKASGISRHHARMLLKDDVYFLEDLNSTNGTTVEGGLLTYKTKVSLKKGALICFANQPYRFL